MKFMKIFQSRLFEKKVKKLNKNEKKELDNEIRNIIDNPWAGIEKKGDLRGISVYKFNLQNQLYVLAYRFVQNEYIQLIIIGPHENYYRDLKNYLKTK